MEGRCIFFMLMLFFLNKTADSFTECDEAQMMMYSVSVIDMTMVYSAGCHSLLSARVLEGCCDAVAQVLGVPCVEEVILSPSLSICLSLSISIYPSLSVGVNV
eukprot:Rmarinus@m.18713